MEEKITITLSDGEKRLVQRGTKLLDIAGKDAVAAHIDGGLVDLSKSIEKDVSVSFISAHSRKGLEVLRHSAAHVMAQAVKELFPSVKLTFGPSTEGGFYYDFDYEKTFTPQDLESIEGRMKEIIKKDEPFIRNEVRNEEATLTFKEMGESYKVEHMQDLPDRVSLYRQGSFVDLCGCPHIPSTGKIKAFKLLSVSGTYWRGDSRNQVLQRIYGTAFPDSQGLKDYLHMLEEAKKRDHRKLGRELDLSASTMRLARGWSSTIPKEPSSGRSSKILKERNT